MLEHTVHGTVVTTVVGLPLESVVVMWETTSVSTLPLDLVTTVVWSALFEHSVHGTVVTIVVGLPLESVVVMWETTSVSTLLLDLDRKSVV